MQEITAWLQNPDYTAGLKLYEKYGSSNFLKLKFAAGPNAYNQTKLLDELTKLAPAAPAKPVISLPDKVIIVTPDAVAEPPKADQVKYLQLIKRKDRLYLELNQLMEQKHYLPEGPDLKACAGMIVSRHQQLTEAWAQIDHYTEHQSFPVEAKQPAAAYAPEKEIQLLRQSISKANTRLSKPTCRNREQTTELVKASQARLDQLLTERNAHE
jgi:hypothetical protein